MWAVRRGAELSILSSLSAPTDGFNAEPLSPDSAHRPRLADVALSVVLIVGLQLLTSGRRGRSVLSKRLVC